MFKRKQLEKNNVIESYNELLREQQKNNDYMSNLTREKDYRVQKIEKHYQSIIEDCIRKEEVLKLQIAIAKKYVDSTDTLKKEGK